MRDSSPPLFRGFRIPFRRHPVRRRRGATGLQRRKAAHRFRQSSCAGTLRWLPLGAVLFAAAPPTLAEQVERWTLERTVVIGDAMDAERGLTEVGNVAVSNGRLNRRALREAFDNLDFFPPVERIHAGTDGTTWLELRVAEDEFDWEVLDRAGEPLGRFRAPEGARLEAGDLGGAWFVEHDELDIPYLARYNFARPN